MPIVYSLTNECMPETIKVGVTENLDQRIRQMDNTSVALPFECYYAVEVDDADAIEKKMHQGLDEYRVRPNREFFNTSPEIAKSLLEIAEVMGGKNVTSANAIVETEQDRQALVNAHKKRETFNFDMLDIQPGTALCFKKDESITCEVIDDRRVRFRGKNMSLSASANLILKEMGYDWKGAAGPRWWCFNGETLYELRRQGD